MPVGLLRCRQPGKGIAVRAGLLATGAPFVGYCDADMATDLGAMDPALRLLAAGYGAVIGSRALEASEVEDRHSPARKVGATMFRTLARGIVPGVTDTQCGFKFFSGPLARAAALPLRTAGFAFDIELIANCLRLGATLAEIPVRWRDVSGSTFSVRRHSAAAFRDMASIWLRSRIGGGRVPARRIRRQSAADPPGTAVGRHGTIRGRSHDDMTTPAIKAQPSRPSRPRVLAARSRTCYSYVSRPKGRLVGGWPQATQR